jgi:hypothetical protein
VNRCAFIACLVIVGAAIGLRVMPAGAARPTSAESPRPTVIEAHNAVHIAYDNYADVTQHRLLIGACIPAGSRSRACDVQLTGPVPQRWRVVVTERPEDFQVHSALAR